ncbi:GNAT family N-acetyltransferase [Nocardiopsis alba]|uniref:GNAT family N-acetyltransferase n=1 Tax=Nocardiopsis alba TaxID=53437 RepID=UPI0033F8E9E4
MAATRGETGPPGLDTIPRRAGPDDVPTLIELRVAAAEWLRSIGSDQWHDTARAIADIEAGVASGTTWVVDRGGRIDATLTLGGPDLDFWNEEDDLADALYLYKFMVRAAERGGGLGDAFLEWACARTAAQGRHRLRLDCWRTNHALHRYYRERGFRHLRTVRCPGRGSGALFQRPVLSKGEADVRSARTFEGEA